MSRIKPMKVLAGLFPAVFLCFLVCCQAYGAGGKTDGRATDMGANLVKSDSPISITADRMEAKQDDRTIVFEGHVVVTQDDLTITSNRLKVTALPAEKQSSKAGEKSASTVSSPTDKIDYIEFEGDVKVTQQDRLATANKAIFYQREQKIVMNGRPVVTKGQDRIEGELITIFIQQGRSVVESGSGAPVKAVLFPGKKD